MESKWQVGQPGKIIDCNDPQAVVFTAYAPSNCKTCKFWKPAYFQHGLCSREFSPHSKIHSDGPENTRIVTHATFHCSEFESRPPEEKDTL